MCAEFTNETVNEIIYKSDFTNETVHEPRFNSVMLTVVTSDHHMNLIYYTYLHDHMTLYYYNYVTVGIGL